LNAKGKGLPNFFSVGKKGEVGLNPVQGERTIPCQETTEKKELL